MSMRAQGSLEPTSEGLEVYVLGSGSASPDPRRGHPSHAVCVGGEALLFDCGERATVNLVRAGIRPLDVDRVFFTHLHWDHIADFNYLLMTMCNGGRRDALEIWGPNGTRAMTQSFLEAHRLDIEFFRVFADGLPDHIAARPTSRLILEHHDVRVGTIIENDDYRVIAAEVEHLNLLGFDHADWAYRVDSTWGSVAFSGDTIPCDGIVELARGVDILVHEATFLEEVIAARAPAWTGHSSPQDAGRVATRAGAKKLVLSHLGPYDSSDIVSEMSGSYYGARRGPDIWSRIIQDAASEYDGPIVLAEDAMLLTP